jgi:hypothetical protein
MGRSDAPAAGVGRDDTRVGRGGAPAAGVGRDDARVGRDGNGRRIGRRPEWGGWRVGGDGDLGNKIKGKKKIVITDGSRKKFTNKPKIDMSELRFATSALTVGPIGQKSC